jgi:hypothetical protein
MEAKGECHLLFVPVRASALGTLALRTGRLPSGPRVGLAFTSEASLRSALGAGQPWIRLDEDAMRAMLMPLGIAQIRVDIAQIRVDACLPAPAPAPAATRPAPAPAATPAAAPAGPATPKACPKPVRKPRHALYRCASLTQARAVPGGGPRPTRSGGDACTRPVPRASSSSVTPRSSATAAAAAAGVRPAGQDR